jgi:hypothetical protein
MKKIVANQTFQIGYIFGRLFKNKRGISELFRRGLGNSTLIANPDLFLLCRRRGRNKNKFCILVGNALGLV